MPPKRPRADDVDVDDDGHHSTAVAIATAQPQPQPRPPKRRRRAASAPAPGQRCVTDLLSRLPSEILIRILGYLSLRQLLAVTPVSARLRLAAHDNELWKDLYYARFVLPRAMRIPGFRGGGAGSGTGGGGGFRSKGLGGRGLGGIRGWLRPGMLGDHNRTRHIFATGTPPPSRLTDVTAVGNVPAGGLRVGPEQQQEWLGGRKVDRVNWMRQFKIRHNWSRGKCAVEELRLGPGPGDGGDMAGDDSTGSMGGADRSKMLVKVVEGLAVTVDMASGLRAWDLKTREVIAQANLGDGQAETETAQPSCIAIDDQSLNQGTLEVSVGFVDGSFGVWALSTQSKTISRRYRHEKSSNGELIGMAYSHPYLLTATRAMLISLYTFDVPPETTAGEDEQHEGPRDAPAQGFSPKSKLKIALRDYADDDDDDTATGQAQGLPAPYLMTSLTSHNSNPPLALSIRKTAGATIASIAYTFLRRHDWSIGIQDLYITPGDAPGGAPAITTRLAHTVQSVDTMLARPPGTTPPGYHPNGGPPPPPQPHGGPNQQHQHQNLTAPAPPAPPPPDDLPPHPHPHPHPPRPQGPSTLCYSHPYLLATLPDNTLVLYLCTSTAAALSISPGIRLWGHTSGISDAEITARGKAVSVSGRGGEMRVWELEGRPSGVRSRSVAVRAAAAAGEENSRGGGDEVVRTAAGGDGDDWEERRNWVGFDDEMVIVLKEARGGRESLLVYDFT